MRTIVIDENTSVCAALSIILEEWRHDVIPTNTLLEAVHKLPDMKYSPDIIIINVPYYHYENDDKNINLILDALEIIFPSSDIIIMTEEINNSLKIAANDYGWSMLIKPFSEEDLRGALLRATSKSKH
ncbi:hypothetical protein FW320_14525 [Azospirillum sp. Vi22]|uniref:hypothetical protein n=1 Tax=Azospirillum baldaniorum TaxID=1064539 RepID=UPI00157AADC9|nr:hypothetical protein [Azospirillum baldaniorum]NUB07385.1 hypothetical protein [Azospirillum baldaniorum]